MASSRVCSIEDCGKPHEARGWCKAHYRRWERHGDPLAGGTPASAAANYLKNVVLLYRGDECLYWPFATVKGYGNIKRAKHARSVHRIVCEEIHGPPPTPDHQAAHSCGNGHLGCVTGGHLHWATPAQNAAEKIAHGRSARGSRARSNKLTEEQVRKIRQLRQTMTLRAVAAQFGVSRSAIRDIARRRSWGWLP